MFPDKSTRGQALAGIQDEQASGYPIKLVPECFYQGAFGYDKAGAFGYDKAGAFGYDKAGAFGYDKSRAYKNLTGQCGGKIKLLASLNFFIY